MQSINALSLAPESREWLANSYRPSILHVFDHVTNLINERMEVLSIVTTQIGNGPFNLVVEDDVLFSPHFKAESRIFIRANELQLEDLTIDITNAELWSPCPNWQMLYAKRDDILNQLITFPITNYQALLPNSLISNLSMALAIVDIPSSLSAARGLAGLGQGLTPAGDDFIMGAVLAARIIHSPDIASVLAEEITRPTAPLTTSLSAAWLRSAGKGEAGILWHHLFDALSSSDSVCIRASLDKILAVGESSGADALAGFIGTLLCWTQVASSKLP